MMNLEIMNKLMDLKKEVLVFDLETCSSYPDGTRIDIGTNFEDYVKYAKSKFFGAYSYKYEAYVGDIVKGNQDKIINILKEHKVLVGFNNEEFDHPILFNNDLIPVVDDKVKRYLQVDLLVILGDSTYTRHDGLPFKAKGGLMNLNFKSNSLRSMAEAMKLETQKGDIDYNIFFKDEYTPEELEEIFAYLKADVMATKQMFDKVWDYWLPFTEYLSEKNILNLSWIRSSVASLTYKAACHTMGEEDTYAERKEGKTKEKMGGRVIEPKYEEARDVWYVDFASLYPHMYCMFNLFAEADENSAEVKQHKYYDNENGNVLISKIWHGNDIFQVKGYYDISEQHILSKDVASKLKTRMGLKVSDPDSPMIYTLKIFLNSLYGAQRSEVFEKIYTPNGGWDCCQLGQQVQKITESMFKEFGFETIYGDTDSIMVVARDPANSNEPFVRECLQKVIDKIKDNVPFPAETFNIDLEHFMNYIMFPFDYSPIPYPGETNEKGNPVNAKVTDPNIKLLTVLSQVDIDIYQDQMKNGRAKIIKRYTGKKKNYVYIYEKKGEKILEIKGLPIIKNNATEIGPIILEEYLRPRILKEIQAKFPKDDINKMIKEVLDRPEGLALLSVQYKVKPAASYAKPESQIQAQISSGYFDGQAGVIRLIKNKKVGKAGKGSKYATAEEIREAGLTIDDINMEKLQNELAPFIKDGE